MNASCNVMIGRQHAGEEEEEEEEEEAAAEEKEPRHVVASTIGQAALHNNKNEMTLSYSHEHEDAHALLRLSSEHLLELRPE